jgi:hypothetical protein
MNRIPTHETNRIVGESQSRLQFLLWNTHPRLAPPGAVAGRTGALAEQRAAVWNDTCAHNQDEMGINVGESQSSDLTRSGAHRRHRPTRAPPPQLLCVQNGQPLSRGGCQHRGHSLVHCHHGDSTPHTNEGCVCSQCGPAAAGAHGTQDSVTGVRPQGGTRKNHSGTATRQTKRKKRKTERRKRLPSHSKQPPRHLKNKTKTKQRTGRQHGARGRGGALPRRGGAVHPRAAVPRARVQRALFEQTHTVGF